MSRRPRGNRASLTLHAERSSYPSRPLVSWDPHARPHGGGGSGHGRTSPLTPGSPRGAMVPVGGDRPGTFEPGGRGGYDNADFCRKRRLSCVTADAVSPHQANADAAAGPEVERAAARPGADGPAVPPRSASRISRCRCRSGNCGMGNMKDQAPNRLSSHTSRYRATVVRSAVLCPPLLRPTLHTSPRS